MNRYLVTGGAGFIGSHLVEELLTQGHFVRVLDNFETGKRENLGRLSGPVEIQEGTIEDPESVRKAVNGIDFVLHQAALGSVPGSIEDPAGTHRVNIMGTLNVLIASREALVKRVIYASSAAVYGDPAALPQRESLRPSPMSPYAVSKLIAEQCCRAFYEVYKFETVCLRYFNVYGPRQNPHLQYAAVVPIFISNLLQQKPCVIEGDGEQTRDFIYVEDCVRANLLACQVSNGAGEVFNIGSGNQTSVNRLLSWLKEVVGSTTPSVHEPPRVGDLRASQADITKASTGLQFEPRITLKEGLKKTVEWYRAELHSPK